MYIHFEICLLYSTGFDVAKTGDARIGFVGKSGLTLLENNTLLYLEWFGRCQCSNSIHSELLSSLCYTFTKIDMYSKCNHFILSLLINLLTAWTKQG